MAKERMKQEPKNQEPNHQEVKLEETKKSENLRANAVPVDGFILSVDGKLKARYDTSEAAMTAASKLKQSFPVIQVAVYDAAQRVYTSASVRIGVHGETKLDEGAG
jgi:hypothetical protein